MPELWEMVEATAVSHVQLPAATAPVLAAAPADTSAGSAEMLVARSKSAPSRPRANSNPIVAEITAVVTAGEVGAAVTAVVAAGGERAAGIDFSFAPRLEISLAAFKKVGR